MPTRLTIYEGVVASVVVMSLPGGVAVRFTEYDGSQPGVRAWMRRWFEDRLDGLRNKPQALAESTSVLTLSVQRTAVEGEYSLVEAIDASSPSVPEDWPEIPVVDLLVRVIAFL